MLLNAPHTRSLHPDLFLKVLALVWRERVCLGDDWDDVDFVVEPFHELHVQGLQAVPRGRDEVQAAVHPVVCELLTGGKKRALVNIYMKDYKIST